MEALGKSKGIKKIKLDYITDEVYQFLEERVKLGDGFPTP